MTRTLSATGEDKIHETTSRDQTQTLLAEYPSVEQIRQRAYEIHLERGSAPGSDQDDWLQAERDLKKQQTN
jgi:Protein of unknown function (DUF2934)